MLKTNSITPLSKRDLNEIAPSIFTTVPSPEVTDKYTHIPTEKVIDDMELLGWLPVEAKEVKARTKDTSGYQKHLVVFRNNDVVINGADNFATRYLVNDASFFAKKIPSPSTIKSISCTSLPRIKSLTTPPTIYTLMFSTSPSSPASIHKVFIFL